MEARTYLQDGGLWFSPYVDDDGTTLALAFCGVQNPFSCADGITGEWREGDLEDLNLIPDDETLFENEGSPEASVFTEGDGYLRDRYEASPSGGHLCPEEGPLDIDWSWLLYFLGHVDGPDAPWLVEGIPVREIGSPFARDGRYRDDDLDDFDPPRSAFSGSRYPLSLSGGRWVGGDLRSFRVPAGVRYLRPRAFGGIVSLERAELTLECLDPAQMYVSPWSHTPKTSGRYAFQGCRNLKEIVLPEGMELIPAGMFEGCSSLVEVRIPSTVKRIGSNAFRGCESLVRVELPAGLEEIGYAAFAGCEKLALIELSEAVKVARNAFTGCPLLPPMRIPRGTTVLGEGMAGGRDRAAVEIPAGVVEIGEHAFEGYAALTSVKIPEGVTRIGEGAFAGCTALESVELPPTVELIEKGAFEGCASLASVGFPGGIGRAIPYRAFSGCTSLESIEIPEGVEEIGPCAFKGCASLKSVTLPSSLREIRFCAFEGCASLAEIKGDLRAVKIGDRAFDGCSILHG